MQNPYENAALAGAVLAGKLKILSNEKDLAAFGALAQMEKIRVALDQYNKDCGYVSK